MKHLKPVDSPLELSRQARSALRVFAAKAVVMAATSTPIALIALIGMLQPKQAIAADAVVFSVYQAVDLGTPPGSEVKTPEVSRESRKDYFVNIGTSQGIRAGTILEVSRRIPTYDLIGEKLYKETTFPIGTLKVIHADQGVAIARLEGLLPADKAPVFAPRAVMVGDFVRKAN
jgi:hypothetical protein